MSIDFDLMAVSFGLEMEKLSEVDKIELAMKSTVSSLAELRRKLRPGDIIFTAPFRDKVQTTAGRYFFKPLSKAVQGTDYGHTAIYVGDGEIVESRIGEGTNKRTLDSVSLKNKIIAFRPKVSIEDRKAAVEYAEGQIGTPYSNASLFRAALPLRPAANGNKEHVSKQICSALIADAYRGHSFADVAASVIRPIEILKSDLLEPVATFNERESAQVKTASEEKEPFYKRHSGKLLAGLGAAATIGVGAYLRRKGLISFKPTAPIKASVHSSPNAHVTPSYASPAIQAPLASASRPPKSSPFKPFKAPKPPKRHPAAPRPETGEPFQRQPPAHLPKLAPPRQKTFVYDEHYLPGGLVHPPKAITPVAESQRLDGALRRSRYQRPVAKPAEVGAAMDNLFEGVPKRNAIQTRLHAAKKPTVTIRKKDGTVKKASSFLDETLTQLLWV